VAKNNNFTRSGPANGKWAGGISITNDGYLRVRAGPLRGRYLHRIVAEAMLGRPLTEGEEVHHRDGDRLNFHPTNLIVVEDAEHKQLHRHAVVEDNLDAESNEDELPF